MGELADSTGVRTANAARTLLFSAYKQAIRWQLTARNPVEATDPLRAVRKDMELWTGAQASYFLDTARAHRLFAAFNLVMTTGLRWGELLGLRWADVSCISGNNLPTVTVPLSTARLKQHRAPGTLPSPRTSTRCSRRSAGHRRRSGHVSAGCGRAPGSCSFPRPGRRSTRATSSVAGDSSRKPPRCRTHGFTTSGICTSRYS